jgi:hypothetical protein
MSKRAILSFFLFSLFSFLFLTGCVSLVEKTGRVIDGSAFAEKKIAVYRAGGKKDPSGMEVWQMRNKAGENSCIIMLDKYPTIRIRGSAPEENGEFNLVSLDYLGGSPHGWNEYRMDLFGEGRLVLSGTKAAISISPEIEPIQISSGRIKRYDTRITGSEAVTSLRNRRERITALAEWMNDEANVYREAAPKGQRQNLKSFKNYWKPILLPETVSNRKKRRGWERVNDQWIMAEDIRWNTGYTERVFPEELRAIRNSGTMLRDWEEALDWIYNEYEWNNILARLSQENVLTKK